MRVFSSRPLSLPCAIILPTLPFTHSQKRRELTIERTNAGLAVARARGRFGGRKRKMTESKVEAAKKLLAAGSDPKVVAKDLSVSLSTLYRWIPDATTNHVS